jgi:hypothetical protein
MSYEESTSSKDCSSQATYPTASLTCLSSNNPEELSASASSDNVSLLDDNLCCTIPGSYGDKRLITGISSRSPYRPPPCFQDCTTSSVKTAEDSSMLRHILCDRLTVFQAAPLVFRDNKGQLTPLLSMLDFTYEREILTKAIGTNIDVEFQIATRDRLGEVLAREEGQILHFSCHARR